MTYDRVHFHARNLMLHVTAPHKFQISLRPLWKLRWIPGLDLNDRQVHPIAPELLREFYLFVYSVCPPEKVRWVHMVYLHYTLELLTPIEQTQMLTILKEWYGPRRPSE